MFTKQEHKVVAEHQELNKKRKISSSDKVIAKQKMILIKSIWDKEWQRKLNVEQHRQKAWINAKDIKEKKILADQYTKEAKEYLRFLNNIFSHALIVDNIIDFDSLAEFIEIKKPVEPSFKSIPDEPCETDPQFVPDLKIMEKLLSSKKQKKIEELKKNFQECHIQWEQEKYNIENERQIAIEKYQKELENWKIEKDEIVDAITSRKEDLLNGKAEAIVDFADMVLLNSNYPDSFLQDFDLDYDATKKRLIVQYLFPSIDNFKVIKKYKYNKKKDALEKVHESENSVNAIYDDTLYQIAIRTIYEIFSSDTNDNIKSIVFTGWVKSKMQDENEKEVEEIKNCVMSIVADLNQYKSLNFERMNAKSIFSKFNGVVNGKLSKLNKVTPYLEINFEI
jgi:restriction system protein